MAAKNFVIVVMGKSCARASVLLKQVVYGELFEVLDVRVSRLHIQIIWV
jgi:hypothetical protein